MHGVNPISNRPGVRHLLRTFHLQYISKCTSGILSQLRATSMAGEDGQLQGD